MSKSFFCGDTEIQFNERKHQFSRQFGQHTVLIPSVTQFTGIIDKSAPLLKWAERLSRERLIWIADSLLPITPEDIAEATSLYQREKAEAAEIGNLVHTAIEEWVKRDVVPDTTDMRILNAFEAFREFEKDYQPEWIAAEQFIYSRQYDFAGIFDLLGSIKGEKVLIDLKSGNSLYPEYAFQTAGYQLAYEEMTGETIDYRMLLRLDKKKIKYEVKECRNNKEDRKAFLCCQFLRKRLRGVEAEWKGVTL
jgi:CRISPR/Cas system-associated exonuclease Cas4 (RecB family)